MEARLAPGAVFSHCSRAPMKVIPSPVATFNCPSERLVLPVITAYYFVAGVCDIVESPVGRAGQFPCRSRLLWKYILRIQIFSCHRFTRLIEFAF